MHTHYHSVKNSLNLLSLLILGALASPLSSPTQPLSISVTPSFVANFAENTHISIGGSSGLPTLIPIVGGPECWFCPDTGSGNVTGGWALLGLKGPGEYQPITSEFPEPIPLITVLSNGDPTYSPTITKESNITKRNIPIKIVSRELTMRYKKLMEAYERYRAANPAIPAWDWKETGDFAIKVRFIAHLRGTKTRPTHGLLAAGNVTSSYEDKIVWEGAQGSKNRKKIRYDRKIYLDFDAFGYDMAVDDQGIFFVDRKGSAKKWAEGPEIVVKWLGTIKPTATEDFIKEQARRIAADMDCKGYGFFTNNCMHFVDKLWDQIKA